MATVTALQSFVGRLSKDKVDPKFRDADGKHPRKVTTSLGDDHFPGYVIESGEAIQVIKGQNFDSNHRVVKAFPTMFGLVETLHPVEQATAAPGEKRGR
jgi:hypothetical protein